MWSRSWWVLILVATIVSCWGELVRSDGGDPRYKSGDQFPLFVNKVGPFNNPRSDFASFVDAVTHIPSVVVVLINSISYLPCAAQSRLSPSSLFHFHGSVDKTVDSALIVDLGLTFVHVTVNRAKEVTNSVMALVLG
ncbi:hypothetical protein Drorol1_Dr00027941 [Drosera rotundifolia]